MEHQFMVFNDEDSATVALDLINSRMEYPHVGVNAFTGEPDPSALATVRWAEVWPTDTGHFVFVAPEEKHREGITGYTLEPWRDDWFVTEPFIPDEELLDEEPSEDDLVDEDLENE